MTRAEEPNSVTVVIPVYNAAKWIGETLLSVAAQTVGPQRLEVIVVDDGSTDDSAGIAERFLATAGFRRWEVVRQPNRGPSAARNVGWRWGRCEWVRFLDADDLIDPEITAIQLAAGANDPAVAVIYSDWCYIEASHGGWQIRKPIRRPRVGSDGVTDLLLTDNGIATGSYICQATWLNRTGGWNESNSHWEDYDLLFRFAFAGGSYLHAKSEVALFSYRRHGPSLSTTSSKASSEGALRVVKSVEDTSRLRNELTLLRVERISEIYGVAARCLAIDDMAAANVWINHLLTLNPTYRPGWTRRFSLCTSLVGFRNAIRIAVAMRKVQSRFRRPSTP